MKRYERYSNLIRGRANFGCNPRLYSPFNARQENRRTTRPRKQKTLYLAYTQSLLTRLQKRIKKLNPINLLKLSAVYGSIVYDT